MTTYITHIKELIQCREKDHGMLSGSAMKTLPTLQNAWLKIEDDRIAAYGSMDDLPEMGGAEEINASGRMVFPAWVDSHTHLVFAGSREGEFVDRIHGLSYQEIAQKGGGILNSAKRLQSASEEELLESARHRLNEVMALGTGAIEIKSGYGLSVAAELKMLRVIKRLKAESPIPIKATFLGAHAYPEQYKENHQGYLDLIIQEMLPQIDQEGLADYIDVFCEKMAFSVAETEQVIKAGAKYGLRPKIHTNQFYCMGGIELSVAYDALSVDHLEVVNEAEIECLQKANTIATLLPSAPFFLGDHYQPARKLLDADIPVALASDYNPGSTPSGNMNFVVALACIKLKMSPEEAINAATVNAAYALNLENELGSITVGKKANLFITEEIPSYAFLPYSFGRPVIDRVMINGKLKS